MSAKSQLDRLVREGENIGSWAGKKIHKVEFLYEAAEKCRAEGYKQYQNQRLDISYVMFLRFAKFFELIRTQPSLDPKAAAHKKCKLDLLAALSLMEELKAKLLVKYGESPAVAAAAMAMTTPADEDVADLTQTLEARFNKLKPAPAPKPAAAPPTAAAYGGPAPAQGGGLGGSGAPPIAISAMDALEARMAKLQPPAPAPAPAPAPDEAFADMPLATGAAGVAVAATACGGGVGGGGYGGGVGGGYGAACSVASSSSCSSSHTTAATGAAEALRAEALRGVVG